MAQSESTRWTIIRGAAEGRRADRKEFARRYVGVVRAYLGARWRGTPLASELDDAAQEVFVECFKDDGALSRVSSENHGRFRTFLYAVVRNVARRVEQRVIRAQALTPGSSIDLQRIEARDEPLSDAFDRAWAMSVLERAGRLHAERARAEGPDAERRREVLELRFGKQMPIREIAACWDEDPVLVHRAYALARTEFKRALLDVVRREEGVTNAEAECARLLACLQ